MEGEGCPACYPTSLEFPLQNPPERYRAIISYYKSIPGTGKLVLCAQRLDWKAFREFQKVNRQYYVQRGIKPFSHFEEAVRQRRQRHNLEGDVHLRPEAGQQHRLENWIEFQDYHLQRLEKWEKSIGDLESKLNKSQEEVDPADAAASEHETLGAESYDGGILESTKWRLKQLKVLLQWTEQERVVMDAGHARAAKGGGSDDRDGMIKAAVEAATAQRRSTRKKGRAILGPTPAGVSKKEPSKRKGKTQPQKPKVQEAEAGIANLSTPQSVARRTSDSRKNKSRRTKEKGVLGPQRPGKISKVKRPADVKGESTSGTRPQGVAQRRPRTQAQSPQERSRETAPAVVTARIGRVSRIPEVWWVVGK